MELAKATTGVAAVAAGASLVASYDRRMFFMDNALNFGTWASRMWPKLMSAESHAELRKLDRQQVEMLNKLYPLDKTAWKLRYGIDAVQVPVEGGEIEVKVYTPAQAADGAPLPLIVWFHGGGMVLLDHNDPFLGADLLGGLGILEHFQGRAVIASVGYRLAPEHPFPTGANDAIAALRFLHANAARLGCDPARVSVAGFSGGGYLAAVASQAARDAGIELRAAVLVAPMLRWGGTTRSFIENGHMPSLSSASMMWFWQTYCPDRASSQDPLCEPIRGVGAGGLAPTLVLTNEFDVLRDEGFEYFEALQRAGVKTEHVRCRASHAGPAFDKDRWRSALRWWSGALGVAESRL